MISDPPSNPATQRYADKDEQLGHDSSRDEIPSDVELMPTQKSLLSVS
jgi:hypothetical protein